MSVSRFSLLCALVLSACASLPPDVRSHVAESPREIPLAGPRATVHSGDDDLLSAGIGVAGLRTPQPPALADPQRASAAELRRRAIWANWRGIADLSPQGHGVSYGSFEPVPGREIQVLLRLPDARQPHRVLLQLPDRFDPNKACVVVAAASGSRGVYGAIALAGGWGLPRGCAVIHTDKGAGTDWIAPSERFGHALDGRLPDTGAASTADEPASESAFVLDAPAHNLAFKHAHSADHPEARWGEYVVQAARWGLQELDRQFPAQRPSTAAQTRLIALGVSNGGGAVLQAAGLTGIGWDGVVAVSPNVLAGEGELGLYHHAIDAALWMPCALTDARFDATPFARPAERGLQRCAALHARGLLQAGTPTEQAAEALARLRDAGWSDAALEAGALSVAFDLWRSVAAAYSSAYLRRGPDDMPCGYRYGLLDAQGQPRSATAIERQLWWSDSPGIPPAAGVALIDPPGDSADPALAGLLCLSELRHGESADSALLAASIEQTRAQRPPADLPIYLLHGEDDGLVPLRFTSAAYAAWLRQAPNALRTQWIPRAQHFDAFVGMPLLQGRYQALMPHAYAALDALWIELEHAATD